MRTAFFAYAQHPDSPSETIADICTRLLEKKLCDVLKWDQLKTQSGCVLHEIQIEISKRDILIADLTTLNPNVLFEVGFAMGKNKCLLLSLDTSYPKSVTSYKDFNLLLDAKYFSSVNDNEILNWFYQGMPNFDHTLYQQLIAPHINASNIQLNLLYLKPNNSTPASNKIDRLLSNTPLDHIVDDPLESTNTLAWYTRQLSASRAVLAHFQRSERNGSDIINARQGLICGLAVAMNKPVLILMENGFEAPFDYRDLGVHYVDGNQAQLKVKEWLTVFEEEYQNIVLQQQNAQENQKKLDEVRGVYLGEYIAEQEVIGIADYYVETAFYRDALAGRTSVLIGRKGSGKTAAYYKLDHDLKQLPHSFVCLIKPEAYDFHDLIDITRSAGGVGRVNFALQAVWKYLLLTEVCVQLKNQLSKQEAHQLSANELSFLESASVRVNSIPIDFSTRLEEIIGKLKLNQFTNTELTSTWRESVSETMHTGPIRELQRLLGPALTRFNRISILVDNLDKAWEDDSDVTQLREFILALLGVGSKSTDWLGGAEKVTSLYLFLRSDIFHRVRRSAREEDKLKYRKLDWNDKELLYRIIEERYEAFTEKVGSGCDIWKNYFANSYSNSKFGQNYFGGDSSVKDWISDRIMPRPRDLVYFVSAAFEAASNRGHLAITQEDMEDAYRKYSSFATASILTEIKTSGIDGQSLLYEFLGADTVLTHSRLAERLEKAGYSGDSILRATRELILVGFLSLRVNLKNYWLVEDLDEYERTLRLAKQFAAKKKEQPSYMISPAFWPYLEIGN